MPRVEFQIIRFLALLEHMPFEEKETSMSDRGKWLLNLGEASENLTDDGLLQVRDTNGMGARLKKWS